MDEEARKVIYGRFMTLIDQVGSGVCAAREGYGLMLKGIIRDEYSLQEVHGVEAVGRLRNDLEEYLDLLDEMARLMLEHIDDLLDKKDVGVVCRNMNVLTSRIKIKTELRVRVEKSISAMGIPDFPGTAPE